jgi:hypothetical protein
MILFLYTFSINRARTSGMFYEELAKRCDGHNLVMLDISKQGLAQTGQYINNAALVVFDNSILLSMGKKRILPRNFYTSQAKSKLFYKAVWEQVNRADKPVFLMHPSSDLHAVDFGLERDIYLEILKKITGIFWPYHRFPMETTGETEDRYPYSTLGAYGLDKAAVLSIWNEIREHVPVSIDFPHCLGVKELDQQPRRKIWDIIIPGVSYQTRQIAQESARNAGLFTAPYTSFSKWLGLAPFLLYDKILPSKRSTRIYQEKSFLLYRYMIAQSDVSFTCGSELKFFVRKFLEVPAFRTAMLAYPSNNFRDYGFEDGVHYLHCYPEETGEKAKYLLEHKATAQKLVKQAWELVAREHIAPVRVTQVLECLNAFLKGNLKSAGYRNGTFEVT